MDKQEDVDVFRDTYVRYMGYANEVGEAFRSLVRTYVVRSSYGVAFSYVFADAISKALKPSNESSTSKRFILFSDAVMWQSFASVIIPGLTINRICAACAYALRKRLTSSPITQKWICTAVGLMSIPLIIQPIDRGVDTVMDNTIRKAYSTSQSGSSATER